MRAHASIPIESYLLLGCSLEIQYVPLTARQQPHRPPHSDSPLEPTNMTNSFLFTSIIALSVGCFVAECWQLPPFDSQEDYDYGNRYLDSADHSQQNLLNPLGYNNCDKGKFRFDWMRQVNNLVCDNKSVRSAGGRHGRLGYKSRASKRILHGYDAELGEFPSYVLLAHRNSTTGSLGTCGGVLLNKYLVLTAAHCLVEGLEMTVYAGSIKYEQGERRQIKRACYPNEFKENSPLTNSYDWAILELKEEFSFNENIQPACLNLDFKMTDNFRCIAVGFGATTMDKTENPIDGRLKAASVKPCIPGNYFPMPITGRICTLQDQHQEGGQVCHGDSGGPLYCFENCSGKPKMYVVGISNTMVTFRKGSACPTFGMGVFTAASSHRVTMSSLIDAMIKARSYRMSPLDGNDELLGTTGARCINYS